MKRQALHSVCILALLVGGCPRHSATRLTYVPAPPSPSTEARAQTASDTMVIEEPPPPAPPEPAPAAANPAPVEPAPRRGRSQAPAAEKPVEPPPVPAPALEPLAVTQSQPSLTSEVVTLQAALAKRIDRDVYTLDLKPGDRQAIEDARGFLAQSLHALQDGDADRAKKLANKASLLLDAVEQGR